MNEDNKYNGWTNYATWRVQLEVVGDYVSQTAYDDADTANRWARELELNELADELKDYTLEVVGLDMPDGLAWNYANAFLDDVNWYEIAEHARQVSNEALEAFDEDDKLASEV